MKPWQYWLAFLVCLGLVLLAMGGISVMVLDLDRAQREASIRAAFEENVRLALWRMENALSPMLARESARPYFVYSSFYPAERAYTRMFEEIGETEVLVPSPLLTESAPHVLLHFQIDPDGAVASPGVPSGEWRRLAVSAFRNDAMIARFEARLCEFRHRADIGRLAAAFAEDTIPSAAAQPLAALERRGQGTESRPAAALAKDEFMAEAGAAAQAGDRWDRGALATKESQKSASEWNARVQQQMLAMNKGLVRAYDQAVEATPSSAPPLGIAKRKVESISLDAAAVAEGAYRPASAAAHADGRSEALVRDREKAPAIGGKAAIPPAASPGALRDESAFREPATPPRIAEGIMRPLWAGDVLAMARRVSVNGKDYVQGCWLDWDGIRTELLRQVRDLLPEADLVPARRGGDTGGRALAGLPARLEPGSMPAGPLGAVTPVRLALVIAWCCILLGAGAVGVLLQGVVSLSERRASFVSAVTHELRTPLTTFRMYAEMLAEGMVADEGKQRQYLATLCAEGNRLSHLVENVLAYARLEKGRARSRPERIGVGAMIGRMKERLRERAARDGMVLEVEDGTNEGDAIETDASIVEQILFNLVDNACKYASDGPDRRIHFAAAMGKGTARLRVRDHGPGIPAGEARHLFKPFVKSAKRAAESKPGVGLGLALSRRLARQMGGDLLLCAEVRDGACFELVLPGVVST